MYNFKCECPNCEKEPVDTEKSGFLCECGGYWFEKSLKCHSCKKDFE